MIVREGLSRRLLPGTTPLLAAAVADEYPSSAAHISRLLDAGGGMAVDYTHPESRFDWKTYGEGLAPLADAHPELTLRIDPDRSLTAYCGWYATEVLDVKHSHGEEFAVVRGGTHHLRTPAADGHDQPCSVLPVEEWPRPAAEGEYVSSTGQLCTPKDPLARNTHAPGLRAGGGWRSPSRARRVEHLAPRLPDASAPRIPFPRPTLSSAPPVTC